MRKKKNKIPTENTNDTVQTKITKHFFQEPVLNEEKASKILQKILKLKEEKNKICEALVKE